MSPNSPGHDGAAKFGVSSGEVKVERTDNRHKPSPWILAEP
jgi:hypothetical protein